MAEPKVNFGWNSVPSVDFAIKTGEIQSDTIGFSFSIKFRIKFFTSSITVPSVPLKAQSLKFFAAPKPPTITRDEIFSKSVRAGKRTYFFDVKTTKGSDLYLTITESKKRTNKDGRFYYEKHKLFLYKEDFAKFADGLEEAIAKIQELKENGSFPDLQPNFTPQQEEDSSSASNHAYSTDVNFEDLG